MMIYIYIHIYIHTNYDIIYIYIYTSYIISYWWFSILSQITKIINYSSWYWLTLLGASQRTNICHLHSIYCLALLGVFFCCLNSTSTCPTFLQLTSIFICWILCPSHLHLLRSHDFRLIQSIWSIFIQSALQITTATHNPSYLYAFLQYLFLLNRASWVFVFFPLTIVREKGTTSMFTFQILAPSLGFVGVTFLFPPLSAVFIPCIELTRIPGQSNLK